MKNYLSIFLVVVLFGCSNKIVTNIEFETNSNNEKIVQADTNGNSNETYEDDDATSVVYFTKDISSDGLLKVYNALNQNIVGNVGIKVSFGDRNEPILDAALLKGLVDKTKGTMFDGNGLSGHRSTAEQNLAIAKDNGYTDVGKCIMVSDTDYIDMPVENGLLLKKARTGVEFDNFDTLVSVHRVKLHNIQAFGGNIKNVLLCLANISGKCIIHSGGTDEEHYHNTEPEVLMKSFADATKAALDYKKNWAFIDVLDDIDPADSCRNTKNQGKIGIIASNDIVALEQCAVDYLINKSAVDELTKDVWKEWHQIRVLDYCEQNKIGNRKYKLVNVDNESINDENSILEKPVITQNGVNIEGVMYRPNGKGPFPTVILTHGFAGNYTYITGNVAKELSKAGFAAYAYNLRNPDTRSMLNTSVLTEAATLNTVIDQIKQLDYVDSSQIFLLGESQGGFVSAYVSANRDDIKSLVLYYPAFVLQDDAKKHHPGWDSEDYEFKDDEIISGMYTKDALSFDIYDEISKYKNDVLIIHGTKDDVVPLSYSERAVSVYEHAKLETIEGAEHGFYSGEPFNISTKYATEFLLEHIKK